MARRRVYVDTETTGLNYDEHAAIEIAYMTDDMNEPELVIPWTYDPADPTNIFEWADPKAMEINKFYERYPNGVEYSGDTAIIKMIDVMRGSTLVGANVRFDARMIEQIIGEVWHHRLFDIEAWAGGIFHLDFPVGWSDCVRLARHVIELNQDHFPAFAITDNDHTAVGDCQSVRDVFITFKRFASAQSWLFWPNALLSEIEEKNERV